MSSKNCRIRKDLFADFESFWSTTLASTHSVVVGCDLSLMDGGGEACRDFIDNLMIPEKHILEQKSKWVLEYLRDLMIEELIGRRLQVKSIQELKTHAETAWYSTPLTITFIIAIEISHNCLIYL